MADGAGSNIMDAVRYWTGGNLVVDGEEWARRSMATYTLRRSVEPPAGVPAGHQDVMAVYHPQTHYDPTKVAGTVAGHPDEPWMGFPRGFAGYERHRRTAPDSAATMTAMVSGSSCR